MIAISGFKEFFKLFHPGIHPPSSGKNWRPQHVSPDRPASKKCRKNSRKSTMCRKIRICSVGVSSNLFRYFSPLGWPAELFDQSGAVANTDFQKYFCRAGAPRRQHGGNTYLKVLNDRSYRDLKIGTIATLMRHRFIVFPREIPPKTARFFFLSVEAYGACQNCQNGINPDTIRFQMMRAIDSYLQIWRSIKLTGVITVFTRKKKIAFLTPIVVAKKTQKNFQYPILRLDSLYLGGFYDSTPGETPSIDCDSAKNLTSPKTHTFRGFFATAPGKNSAPSFFGIGYLNITKIHNISRWERSLEFFPGVAPFRRFLRKLARPPEGATSIFFFFECTNRFGIKNWVICHLVCRWILTSSRVAKIAIKLDILFFRGCPGKNSGCRQKNPWWPPPLQIC